MATFGISAVGGFPPVSDNGFPRFIQFQQDGTNIGDTTVETVNFTGTAELSLSSDGGTLTVHVTGTPPTFSWLDVPGDYTLALTDANNGLASTGTTGAQTFTVPLSLATQFTDGDAILITQGGNAQVQVEAAGSNLVYRDAFLPRTAGENAAITLIYRASTDTWLVCGDMEAV